MSHKRSERIYRIARHADLEQQQASRRMAELRDALQRSEEQLEVLQNYCAGYQGTWSADDKADDKAGDNGGGERYGILASVNQLSNYSAFLGQLNQAVRQQEAYVDQARTAFHAQLERWKGARTRVLALEQVAQRHARGEARQLEKAEQSHADELSLRRFLELAI